MHNLTTDGGAVENHGMSLTPRPAGLRRSAGPGALVLGPVLTAVGFALHPLAAKNTSVFIARINAHPARWALSHLLIGVGLAVFAAGVGSALRLAHGRGGRFVGAGVVAAGAGAAAMGYEAIGHGAVGYALAGRADVALLVSTHVQTAFEHLGFTAATALASILFPLGIVLLGVGALRSPAIPSWGGVLLLVAPIGIQIAGAGPLEVVGAVPRHRCCHRRLGRPVGADCLLTRFPPTNTSFIQEVFPCTPCARARPPSLAWLPSVSPSPSGM